MVDVFWQGVSWYSAVIVNFLFIEVKGRSRKSKCMTVKWVGEEVRNSRGRTNSIISLESTLTAPVGFYTLHNETKSSTDSSDCCTESEDEDGHDGRGVPESMEGVTEKGKGGAFSVCGRHSSPLSSSLAGKLSPDNRERISMLSLGGGIGTDVYGFVTSQTSVNYDELLARIDYYVSEIDEIAVGVARKMMPGLHIIELGCIRALKKRYICHDLPHMDLIISTMPCQDFSLANRNRPKQPQLGQSGGVLQGARAELSEIAARVVGWAIEKNPPACLIVEQV